MPELAEVELSRRQWDPGLGHRVLEVLLPHPCNRVFRGTDTAALLATLRGRTLRASLASGKQMLFEFSGGAWLGIHLGMSGDLRCEKTAACPPRKHDLIALQVRDVLLVYHDTRYFGRIRFDTSTQPPAWWRALPPAVVSDDFTFERTTAFLQRRRGAPLKAVLLMQVHFPGVGNWMADEILWRAHLHPATKAGELAPAQQRTLWQTARRVCRDSLRAISDDWSYPESWLFRHRWEKGGHCPRCGSGLDRATIGGRTTCWCPTCQPPLSKPRFQALKSR